MPLISRYNLQGWDHPQQPDIVYSGALAISDGINTHVGSLTADLDRLLERLINSIRIKEAERSYDRSVENHIKTR